MRVVADRASEVAALGVDDAEVPPPRCLARDVPGRLRLADRKGELALRYIDLAEAQMGVGELRADPGFGGEVPGGVCGGDAQLVTGDELRVVA